MNSSEIEEEKYSEQVRVLQLMKDTIELWKQELADAKPPSCPSN
jgi:hypothetical protein